MGIAIITGDNYSSNNLGVVTFLQNIDVTGLTINCNTTQTGTTFTPTISYTPSTTNQTGVVWSISTGSSYASIDASTGVVTILSGASANTITIVATSTQNSSITASKNVSVTYYVDVNILTAITITGAASINGKTAQYSVSYTPSNTTKTGVTWSVQSGGTYASIDASTGLLTLTSSANASSVVIRATSTQDASIYAEKTITATYSAYTPLLNIFDADASESFGGATTGYLYTTAELQGKTINYFKLHVASDSPTGKTLKYYKVTGIPAYNTMPSSTMLGYITISASDPGTVVVKSVTPFTLNTGEYLLFSSPDGVKWLGKTTGSTFEYMPYTIGTGKVTTVTTGNVNIEPMT